MLKIDKVFILQGSGMDIVHIHTPKAPGISPYGSDNQVFKTYTLSGTGPEYVETVLNIKDYEVINIS